MKPILLVLFFLSAYQRADAQTETKPDYTYKLLVKFESICCGVPDASPLEKAIQSFKKSNNVNTIAATKIAPMGREGEYHIGFTLNELTRNQQNKFIKKIKSTAAKMKDKGQATCELDVIVANADQASSVSRTKITY